MSPRTRILLFLVLLAAAVTVLVIGVRRDAPPPPRWAAPPTAAAPSGLTADGWTLIRPDVASGDPRGLVIDAQVRNDRAGGVRSATFTLVVLGPTGSRLAVVQGAAYSVPPNVTVPVEFVTTEVPPGQVDPADGITYELHVD